MCEAAASQYKIQYLLMLPGMETSAAPQLDGIHQQKDAKKYS
jgi:hypothetical protein